MNYLHFLWLRVDLGSTPGIGLSCTWVSMASAQEWAWIQGKTPGRWPSTTHTKVLVALSPLFFFFLTISSLFTRCFNYLKFTGPNSSGSSSKSVSFSKSSKSESLLHSWHFLYLVLSCFSLHISPWVGFKPLAKWALASPEPSTAPVQPKIWTHI